MGRAPPEVLWEADKDSAHAPLPLAQFIFKDSNPATLTSACSTFLDLPPLSFLYEDFCDSARTTRVIQGNLPSTKYLTF